MICFWHLLATAAARSLGAFAGTNSGNRFFRHKIRRFPGQYPFGQQKERAGIYEYKYIQKSYIYIYNVYIYIYRVSYIDLS